MVYYGPLRSAGWEGTAVAVTGNNQTQTALSSEAEGALPMTKPIEKTRREGLVHHPSDVLDAFCQCDASNSAWLDFDASLSHQIIELEFNNRQYIRVRPQIDRRISVR
jgi:hypothetical protein